MPHLYTPQSEEEIRTRFIQKCDDLITTGRATSYLDICERIEISPASFNQVKSGKALPTLKLLYNLQIVFKVPAESILFDVAPEFDMDNIKLQLAKIHQALDQIEGILPV